MPDPPPPSRRLRPRRRHRSSSLRRPPSLRPLRRRKDDDKSTIRIVAISVTAGVLVVALIVFAVSSIFRGCSDSVKNVVEEGTEIAAGSPGAAAGFAEIKIPKTAANVESRVEAGEAVSGFKVWISFELAPKQLQQFLKKEKIEGLQPAPPAVLEGMLKDACAGAPASVELCPGWRSAVVKDGLGAGRTGQQLIGQLRRPLDMVVVSRESPNNAAVYLTADL